MAGFKPKGAQAREEIVDELRAVNALLIEKRRPRRPPRFASG
jgi:hypothetical protein